MSETREDICWHCRWWASTQKYQGEADCRRYPPTANLIPAGFVNNVEWTTRSSWPITSSGDWCGDFTAKEAANP